MQRIAMISSALTFLQGKSRRVPLTANRPRTIGDTLALALATCGVGFIPYVPATFGSAFTVGLYLLLRHAIASAALNDYATLLLIMLVCIVACVGIRAASHAERLLGGKDPRQIVIDEVAGQLMTLMFVPFSAGWQTIAAGFLLFRFFDVWKPFPGRKLEQLDSGLGIMIDDLVAGFYAAIVLWSAFTLHIVN